MTTTNTYGRQVVIPLTNKSGGSVAAGDVVVVDTSNNDAFTTSTAGAFTGGIGIAQETIASNATGRVLLSGYAALVNVNASVTRGNFGKTHTVAKQATDAGSSRTVGTFCQFLTGGTTPDAMVYPVDLGAGSGLVDPMTTRGDIIVRNSSNATARLAVGAAGKLLSSDGTDVSWAYPPFTGAKAYSSATQSSISASTMTKVTLNAEEYDTSAFHDNVTNNTRMTVPSTGYYLIEGYIYGSSTAGSRVVLGNFFKNNTTVLRGQLRFNESAAGGITIGLTCTQSLTASDYIEMRVWCSGADLTIGDATNIEQQCWMSVTLLGT